MSHNVFNLVYAAGEFTTAVMRTGLNLFSLSPYRNVGTGYQRMRSSAGGASTGVGGAGSESAGYAGEGEGG